MKANLADITSAALRDRLDPFARRVVEPMPARMPVEAPRPQLPADTVMLGRAGLLPFGIRLSGLLDGRLLIQGQSGTGKSWLLRKLIEESAHRVQHIIIDPDGEFRSLADHLDYPVAEGHKLTLEGAAALGAEVRRLQLSVVLDLSELPRERQMLCCAAFIRAMVASEDWNPAMVVIDEAHLFAPFGVQGMEAPAVRREVTGAVVDMMSRGRKRGLATVLATQRFSRLAKSAISEANNMMIGTNTMDVDIRRAAQAIGWDVSRAFDRLPVLNPGTFIPVGPAFAPTSGDEITVGTVQSRHLGATPALAGPMNRSAAAGGILLGLDDLARQAEAAKTDRGLQVGVKAVRAFLRHPGFTTAAAIFDRLRPLYPEGTRVASLATALGLEESEIIEAVALLQVYAVLQTDGEAGNMKIRMDPSMVTR